MALIRATCCECGDVELRSRDVRVRTCAETGAGSYMFRCPICRMIEVKSADDQVVDVLVSAGINLEMWHLPVERCDDRTRPAINHDDALDFHDLLASPDWLNALLESAPNETHQSSGN